jgi:DNA-binding IclR family transcriptional regulator
MTRVTAGLRIVRVVAERLDPTAPITVGAIARELGMAVSGASRLCTELEGIGLLERAEGYGAYRLGRGAIRLSGAAAAPFARSVRFALTLAAQQTGETVFLAAGPAGSMRVVASVESLWTLHSPADVGELIADGPTSNEPGAVEADQQSAVVRVADRPAAAGIDAAEARYVESTVGMTIEVAAPVVSPGGECVAVLAVRLPVNRADQNLSRARHAVAAAKRSIERDIEEWHARPHPGPDSEEGSTPAPAALDAAFRILRHLATGRDSIAGTARATGLRPDRTQRLIESCRRAGLVWASHDRGEFQLGWIVQGWYRAAAAPTMVERGKPFVAETAERTDTCGFLTTLKGMRSFTLVEELEMAGEGLRMSPWLGRAHPIIGSDGGPTLVMDLDDDEVARLFPARNTRQELDVFLKRVRGAARDGVLTMEAFDDAGIVSISAPVRDSSGTVVAAACLVGTTAHMRANTVEFERETRELAARVSALLA